MADKRKLFAVIHNPSPAAVCPWQAFKVFDREGMDVLRREYCGSAAPVLYNTLRCPEHAYNYSFTNAVDAQEVERIYRETKIVTIGVKNSGGWCSCPSSRPGDPQVFCAGIMFDGTGLYIYPIRPRGYVDVLNDAGDSSLEFYENDYKNKHGYAYFRARSIVEAARIIEAQRLGWRSRKNGTLGSKRLGQKNFEY